MVKQVVIAEVKRRAGKFLLAKLLPVIAVIVLFFLLIGAIVESLSHMPIIGDRLAAEVLGDETIMALAEVGAVNYEKAQLYLDVERASYPENKTVSTSVYEEVLSPVTSKSATYLTATEAIPPTSYENTSFNIGDETRTYRLWWQAVGAYDMITGDSNDTREMASINAYESALSPHFVYTFDILAMSDFGFYETYYESVYKVVKVYKDGVLTSENQQQVNQTKKTPLPYLQSVSTMFSKFTFSYAPITISDYNWEEVTHSEVTSYDYETSSTGTYVRINGHYILRTFSNAKLREASYTVDPDGDRVKYYMTPSTYYYSPYNAIRHSGWTRYRYTKAIYRTRYKKVTVKTVTTEALRSKKTGYRVTASITQNNRYDRFMDPVIATEKIGEQDKELAIDFAGLYPNAFEFMYHASPYLGYSAGGLIGGGYSGSGDYFVTDKPSEYIVPILFDDATLEQSVRVTSLYGPGTLTIDGRTRQRIHGGLDIALPTGTPLRAAADGTVQKVAYGVVAGNYVNILHENGYMTRVLHLSQALVREGDRVKQGDIIGVSGNTGYSTGPHLHFEVRNENYDTVNPLLFIPLERK